MGVTLSTTSLSPLSLVSVIIGFISFGFTLGTFLRVVWANLMTLNEAPHEVHRYLTNLRQELLEERASLRVIKKACRYRKRHPHRSSEAFEDLLSIQLDDSAVKTMSDTVRSLIKRFQELERPFLEPGEEGIAQAGRKSRRRSASPYYTHSAYASPPDEKSRAPVDHDREEDPDDERYWPQRVRYADYGLKQRLRWLTRKSQAEGLFEVLTRVQTRRIARQVGEISIGLWEHSRNVKDINEKVGRVEDRVNRVIGVRRIPGD